MFRPSVDVTNARTPSKSALSMELLCHFQQFAIASDEDHKSELENKALCGDQIDLSLV
jgi:hypothetical protein